MHKVLIVDDNASTRMALMLLLRLEPEIGELLQAAEGGEAVRLAERLQPDIVLLDMCLQGMSGLEAARSIRARSPQSHLVAMSLASGWKDDALAAGADVFLEKTELLEAVRRIFPPSPKTGGWGMQGRAALG